MVEIDGAYGEGGGQVLRSSLTLSALTGKPLFIHNIRANRSQPGLRQQHLASVNAIAKITQANVEGNELNSSSLHLIPNRAAAGNYRFDIPTAGALAWYCKLFSCHYASLRESHMSFSLVGRMSAGARSGIISRNVGCQ